MSVLADSRLVIVNTENNSDGIIFVPTKDTVVVGSDLQCDIRFRYDGIESKLFEIYNDSSVGKVIIKSFSKNHQILLNNEVVNSKKSLKSGDIIELLGSKMRWESKADARRMTEMMSRSEKKARIGKILKTKRRITIHKVNLSKRLEDLVETEEKSNIEEESPEEEKNPTTPKEVEANESSTTFATPLTTPARPDKENEANVSQLNLSGTLLTSYTPATPTRSSSRVRKTPSRFETPLTAPASPAKSILSESAGNFINMKTPKAIKKSMYLIDLTTPAPSQNNVKSSPHLPSSMKKTPAVRKDNILLKSALKNSTFKKKNDATPNRKALTFSEKPEQAESSYYSSVIDVSSSSEATFKEAGSHQGSPASVVKTQDFSEFEGIKRMLAKEPNNDLTDVSGVRQLMKTPGKSKDPENDLTNVSGIAELMKTPHSGPSSDDEMKDLFNSISTVLGENEVVSNQNKMEPQEIEGSFQKIMDENPRSVESLSMHEESLERELFEEANKTEMESVDKVFDDLMSRPSISRVYSAAVKTPDDEEVKKRGETVLKWIEDVRESLAGESNQTEQVMSSRYSNVTPNTSIAANPANYDASTPKVSILETVEHLESAKKVKQLVMSPVTRLSVLNDNTEVLENYQLKNVTKSLRSTRKQIGNAMAFLHDISQLTETTFDDNETAMIVDEVNQSQNEEVAEILSLDVAQEPIASNNYIQFATGDDVEQKTQKEIFEITSDNSFENNEENDVSDSDQMSDSEESEVEEITDDSQEDEVASLAPLKFRLSKNDLEDGINPLDDSRTEDEEALDEEALDEDELLKESQESADEESTVAETQQKEQDFVEKARTEKELEEKYLETDAERKISAEKQATAKEKQKQEVAPSKIVEESPVTAEIFENSTADLKENEVTLDNLEATDNNIIETDRSEVFCGNETEVLDETENAEYLEDLEVFESKRMDQSDIVAKVADDHDESEIVSVALKQPEIIAETLELAAESPQEHQLAAESLKESESTLEVLDQSEIVKIEDQPESSVVKVESHETDDINESTQSQKDVLSGLDDSMAQNEDDDFGAIDIPATQYPDDNEVVETDASQDIFDESKNQQSDVDDDFEIPETQQFEDVEKLVCYNTTVDASADQSSTAFETQIPEKDASMFSETEFSHVEINSNLLVSDSEVESPVAEDRDEIDEALKNVSEVPNVRRGGASLLPTSQPENGNKELRKTMVMTKEEVSPKFLEFVEIQNELKDVGNKPTRKRGVSSMPEEIVKVVVDKRKTLAAAPEDEKLDESFFDKAKLQNELKKVDNEPKIEPRGRSLTSEKLVKVTESRKTLAPTAISGAFVEHLKIQNELKNVDDQPTTSTAKRAATLMPADIAKVALNRQSLGEQPQGATEDFIKFAKIQNEMKNLHEGPTNIRAQSLTPQKEIKQLERRTTIVPATSDLFGTFSTFKNTQNEWKTLEECAEVLDRESEAPEPKQERDGDSHETIVQNEAANEEEVEVSGVVTYKAAGETADVAAAEVADKVLSRTFDEEAKAETTENSIEKNIKVQEPNQVTVDEPPCIVKAAYVTTVNKEAAEAKPLEITVDTPRRRRIPVDYSALDSGSKRTPRRGRSASIDTAPSTIKKKRITPNKMKMAKLTEEARENSSVQAEITGGESSKEKEEPAKAEELECSASKEVEVTVAEEKSSRRRGQRVNYTDLAAGTPSKSATAVEPSKERRGRKRQIVEETKETPTEKAEETEKNSTAEAKNSLKGEVDTTVEQPVALEEAEVEKTDDSRRGKVEVEMLATSNVGKVITEVEIPQIVVDPEVFEVKVPTKRGRKVKEVIKQETSVKPEAAATPAAKVEVATVKIPLKRGRKGTESDSKDPSGTEQSPRQISPRREKFLKISEPEENSQRGEVDEVSRQGKKEVEAVVEAPAVVHVPSRRGRKAEVQPGETQTSTNEEKKEVKVSAKRGRKKLQQETESQKSADDVAIEKITPELDKKVQEDEKDSQQSPEAPAQKRGRFKKEPETTTASRTRRSAGKPKENATVEVSNEQETEAVEAKPKNKRVAQLIEPAQSTPTKRGRPAAIVPEPEVQTEVPVARRGRKKNEDTAEVLATPVRGRQAKKAPELPAVEEVEEAPRKGRGRAKKVEPEPEIQTPEEPKEKEVKVARKTKATEPAEVELSPEKKPRRVAALKKVEEAVEEPVRRTRKPLKKETEAEKEPEAPAKRGRGRKAASVEPEKLETPIKSVSSKIKKQVKIMTPMTLAAAKAQQEPEKTTSRAKRNVVEPPIEEEPIAKRSTRVRK